MKLEYVALDVLMIKYFENQRIVSSRFGEFWRNAFSEYGFYGSITIIIQTQSGYAMVHFACYIQI